MVLRDTPSPQWIVACNDQSLGSGKARVSSESPQDFIQNQSASAAGTLGPLDRGVAVSRRTVESVGRGN